MHGLHLQSMHAPVWVPWALLGFVALAALMLVALFVLALVFQRWLLALGIVGLVCCGGLVLGGMWLTLGVARSVRTAAHAHIESLDSPLPSSPAGPAGSGSTATNEPVAVKPAESDAAKQDSTEPELVPQPAWIDEPAKLRNGSYTIVVHSGLYVTPGECQRALEAAEIAAGGEYLDDFLGPGASGLVGLDFEYLRDHVECDRFDETSTTTSVGPMHQAHARLTFDRATQDDLRARWRQAIALERLWNAGGIAGAMLFTMSTALVWLRRSNRRAPRRREAV